jgi:putative transposase
VNVYEFLRERSETGVQVRTLCHLLGVSPSAYYHWRTQPVSEHRRADKELLERIRTIHRASRDLYGSPRIHDALVEQGIRCSRKRVARLMREHRIRAKTARRFRVTTHRSSSAQLGRCVDLVQRNFRAEHLNRTWTSDITYLWTREGWVYLAVVLDLCSRRVVGWDLSARLTTDLVMNALARALETRRNATQDAGLLVLHSDRGSQYTSSELQLLVQEHGLRQSYGFSCFDNAVTESFFHTLKTEHTRFESFETRQHARRSLFDYIEIFYNRQRKHSTLNMKSPVQFEEQHLSP